MFGFGKPRSAMQEAPLGTTLVALRVHGDVRLPPGCVELVFSAAGQARRAPHTRAAKGELAVAYHPGPYETVFAPFAGAPEIGLRLRYLADAADPRVAQQRFDLFLFSEAGEALSVQALHQATAAAVRDALAQGVLELPACTTLDEWHGFRAGLNELLYTRFGLTVDDCVPVDLGDEIDYAHMLRARAGQALAAPPAPPAPAIRARTTQGADAAARAGEALPATTGAATTRSTPREEVAVAAPAGTRDAAAATAPGGTRDTVVAATPAGSGNAARAMASPGKLDELATTSAATVPPAARAATAVAAPRDIPDVPAVMESPGMLDEPAITAPPGIGDGTAAMAPVRNPDVAPAMQAPATPDAVVAMLPALNRSGAMMPAPSLSDAPGADAHALRRLFLELPAWSAGVRLLALPPGAAPALRDVLQRCALAALDVNTMPALAWLAPNRPLPVAAQAGRAAHSVAAAQALDQAWALLARWRLATQGAADAATESAAMHAALLDEADRLTANLAFHLAARRAVEQPPAPAQSRKEPHL
jgi:hypothetical protein